MRSVGVSASAKDVVGLLRRLEPSRQALSGPPVVKKPSLGGWVSNRSPMLGRVQDFVERRVTVSIQREAVLQARDVSPNHLGVFGGLVSSLEWAASFATGVATSWPS